MANLAERAQRLNWRSAQSGRRGAATGARGGFALLTDLHRVADPLGLLDLLPAGSLVVLRDYDAPERRTKAEDLARACRARRLILLVAGDLDLAISLRSGLHLPEWQARNVGARIRLWHRRSGKVLSMAAHARPALVRAAAGSADLIFLSPVFATPSHPGAHVLGRIRFRILARHARVPTWALGGVTERTILGLIGSGAMGVASVGGLTASG